MLACHAMNWKGCACLSCFEEGIVILQANSVYGEYSGNNSFEEALVMFF